MKRLSILGLVAASVAGCSLLIDLQPVPDVGEGGSEASADGTTPDTGIVVEAGDPQDCGVTHAKCDSKKCVNGDCVRRIFVTSASYTGVLGFLAGADGICDTAGTGIGSFMALMSDGDASAISRMAASNAPFVLLNGQQVASSSATLFGDAGIERPIDVTEDGGAPDSAYVWTGTLPNGATDSSLHCAEWTTGSGSSGGTGLDTAKDRTWVLGSAMTCETFAHLYCVEK